MVREKTSDLISSRLPSGSAAQQTTDRCMPARQCSLFTNAALLSIVQAAMYISHMDEDSRVKTEDGTATRMDGLSLVAGSTGEDGHGATSRRRRSGVVYEAKTSTSTDGI